MFGPELRRWRNSRHLSLRALAIHVCYSYSYLAKIESGDRSPPPDLPRRLDEYFDTGGVFEHLYGLGRDSSTLATTIVPTDPLTGKAQCVPASRRQLLKGIVGSSALSVLAAGRATAPIAVGAEAKPIEVFRFAHRTLIDEDNIYGPSHIIPKIQQQVAEIESVLEVVSGNDARELRFLHAQFFEFCGWLYQDHGDHFAAQDWLNVALSRAYLVDDAELTCFILARQSQLAGDTGDGRLAIAAAQAAKRLAPNARLAAIANTYEAHGHALTSEPMECERSYERAKHLAAQSDGISSWGPWLDQAYIAAHNAHSMTRLGNYSAAIAEYAVALGSLGPTFRRDRGVYLARQARAYAGNRDATAAATAGIDALRIAVETGSGRISADLEHLAITLRDQRAPSVRKFHDAFREATMA